MLKKKNEALQNIETKMKILQNIRTKNTFIPIYLNVDGEHLNLFCSDFE